MYNVIKLNNNDNVGIAPMPIPKDANISPSLTARNNIPYGHKISLVKKKYEDQIQDPKNFRTYLKLSKALTAHMEL